MTPTMRMHALSKVSDLAVRGVEIVVVPHGPAQHKVSKILRMMATFVT
jgi:hypothetical protein